MKPNDVPAKDYQSIEFDYQPSPDQQATTPVFHPVVVVGAGPVGLALAIDLAQRGVNVLLLDNDHKLSTGSRAICFAKRTLEIFDRLGCGEPMVNKGVSWKVGRVYFRHEEVYSFDLLPDEGHERPAFINLQQYYVEGYLVERALELPNLQIRWKNTVTGIEPAADHTLLTIATPDGDYRIRAGHVAACDGSRSAVRSLMGLETQGRVFRDRFLIADIRLAGADFPSERRFWFDPPFHPGQSVLLHKQSDGVWRVDFQLGWEADPDEERKHEKIVPRVRAVLDSIGAQAASFEIVWASVYTFACQRMASFRHGRVIFAGDSAHGVSPFGARGANSGVQDAENLAWKLALVLRGEAPDTLLDSYASEREYAADENIRHSTRATDFITPKSEVSRLFRDAVLDLSREHAFARRIVNSGRLSMPATLHGSPLHTGDADTFAGTMVPGAAVADAPVLRDGEPSWLLRQFGSDFTLLVFGDAPAWTTTLPLQTLCIGAAGLVDAQSLAARRYDARPGTAYLIRPDLHVAARWRAPDETRVRAALAGACALR
ncbi:FAD-dependent oxidoreductase [Piscinibacter sp.]|uniref:FAD-dependent oxidoreductase n=1 Tax=Piscinibacter sp. TaxID=1903157 RepID=UPI002CD786E7|nr:FAD-dependent oxidoreductase [Albitalea sp.]HUG26402.1 FAD-dependent oxidoreductase [Albitalea sp.]